MTCYTLNIFLSIFFSIFSNDREACAIPDEKTESVIITGGYRSPRIVKRFNLKGFVENLPNMLTGRENHGCAGYHQDDRLVGWDDMIS